MQCHLTREDTIKHKYLETVTTSCTIRFKTFKIIVIDLGSNVSVKPISIYKKMGIGRVRNTKMTFKFTDNFIKLPYDIVEDVSVMVDKLYF